MNRSLALCFRLLLSVPIAALVPACTADQSSTAQPPSFGGALTATAGPGAGEITLTWSPAISVGGGAITYFVFDTLV
ncbi:MAG TPA: hypothetical protein VE981_02245, partial [Planctomycetota bacterium]|nr:hypothetical protein [Planctomycetota bacterium]